MQILKFKFISSENKKRMWETILFFAEGITAAELGAYSPGFFPVPGTIYL